MRVLPFSGLWKRRVSAGGGSAGLRWILPGGAALVAVLAVFFAVNNGLPHAMVVGDFAILASAIVAAISCGRAATTDTANRRAWGFMAAAAGTYAAGMAVWTFYGLTLRHAYPFPSLADAGFLGFYIPAAIALFSFKRPGATHVALWRTVLDAAVIAASVLIVSWHFVLGSVLAVQTPDLLTTLTGYAYPVGDILMSSSVLVLAMRRQPGERMPWLCFGSGLLILTVTDSIYVKLTFEGVSGATGSPLALGWIAAFLLIGLAPLTPQGEAARPEPRVYALALELLPYLPIVGAVFVFAGTRAHELGPFLLVTGAAGMVLVLARQMLIIFENNRLAAGLEREVVSRTKELEGLASIVNSSADAIVGLSTEGIITSWNPGAERLYGYPAADVIGTDIGFLLPEGRRPGKFLAQVPVNDGTEATSYEDEFRRKDGSLVPVSLTVSPIRGAGGLTGIATIAQDITQRKAAERELQGAREAALESSRLKSEFLATMSHEIRTPMNGMVGLTSLLMETPLDETQRQYAQGIQGAGEALVALINDILDFSKLEAGKVDLDVRPFDVRLLVEEAAGLLAEPAQAKRLELTVDCAPELPARLAGDAGRIRQVLLNLATNAVKFTDAGEVAIRVTCAERGDGTVMVTFEVRDTGIGIAPSDQSRLFQSFMQADASTTRRYGGTGLGLAICRRLTEAMGGTIGVDSTQGAGSTFWFRLTLPVAERTRQAGRTPDVLNGLRVLVVDDNATNRLVLESRLRSWQLRPDTAADAGTALDLAKEAAGTSDPYQVAVLDLCMPGMDGLELARAISADPALASIHMILLTSTMGIDKDQLTAAGVREWLMKPVRSSEFHNRLVRLMSSPKPVARAQAFATQGSAPEPFAAAGARILVVEDNEVNQLVARGMVARLGFAVDLAANGAEAVAATAAGGYAAVLMDCHMPVMDGYEASRVIRRRDSGAARIPIVAMTAGALDGDRERCLAAGMDDYLSKPVDPAQLAAVLRRWAPAGPAPREGRMSLDPERLAVLRGLGPHDGRGVLPATSAAFRRDLPGRLAALERALDDGDEAELKLVAHTLKGAAANIGATAAAALCAELELLQGNRGMRKGPELLTRLEAELALVSDALDREVGVAL